MQLSEAKDIALILTSATTVLATLYYSRKNYSYQSNVLKLQESNLLLQQSNLEIQKENHHLQKSKENENELFKIKIEKYTNIFKLGFQAHNDFRKTITDAKNVFESDGFNEEQFEHFADEIDNVVDKYYDEVLINLAFLPKSIFKLFDTYFDKAYSELYADNDTEDEFKKAFEIINDLESDFLNIIDRMRAEIGIETLNNKLRNRIRHKPQS